ncbi:MAG: monofunctional biosynthetic peptidoglycan transglycosylase [Chitinivibrionales bacterium]|nr:monofunctional biosynthetic peptidoglycan transglycosylase [Chitinivibrionales bacterium]MBD3395765.1 monofunctional biosynthetic peptidoglycan transglycosylase [Chitinivibrionales bacterium]
MQGLIMRIVWNMVKQALVGYAVVFSIAGTLLLVIAGWVVLTPVLRVKHLKTHNPAQTLYMKGQRNWLRSKGLPDTLSHRFVPLDSISPHLVKAVLAAEDDGFYAHPGFDIRAIARAVEHNQNNAGRRRRGASTITQQMAKNLFTGGKRSFERKYRELAYAVLMEHFLGKKRILELYLNYAQWGKNIFGCEAAARHYYQRSASSITMGQAAHLAAVLARPNHLTPHYTESGLLQKRMRVISNNLYRRRSIDTTTWRELGGQDSLLELRATLEALQFEGAQSRESADTVPTGETDSAGTTHRVEF